MSPPSENDHILLLPFMAQGHIIPFTALASLLLRRTPHTITIINTPLNIQRLRSHYLDYQDTTGRLRLESLPFNSSDHGLPPNSENTDSIPSHYFIRLIQASESLRPALEHLLSSHARRPPLCLISDEFMSWSVHSARKFGISHAVFNTSGAHGTAIFSSLWTLLPHKHTDADGFPLPDFPEVRMHRSELSDNCRNADGTDPWSVIFRRSDAYVQLSDGVLINTVEDLETKALRRLRSNRWRKVWPIGPLLPPPKTDPSLLSANSCINWLNLHRQNSVLYISFGSQNSISSQQMMELAKGLEASSCAFIWVIRPPAGFNLKEEFRPEWLPEGFEDRITEGKQGVLVKSWAPQLEILRHESTGGFLSHCGWNSILESLSCGVPIIGWPMDAEQPFNMKLLKEELGVGVQLARGSKMEIRWEDVERVVRLVMDGESRQGLEMRRKAKEMKEIIKAALVEEEGCKGSSIRAIEDFIQTSLGRKER